MEKSTKDTELEKLQKRVEKLEKANKSLKRTNVILREDWLPLRISPISIVPNFKKRKAERRIGQGVLRTNNESIRRHHYSSLMVALSTAFYARLSIGSRQIVEIFNILNEFMGNIFGEVPAYTTIGYWAQELGLSVYKESCTLSRVSVMPWLSMKAWW